MAHTFRVEGIEPKDISLFRSLMTIAEGRLTSPWTFMAKGDCSDVVLIDIDAIGADGFQSLCRKLVGAIPVIYGKKNTLNSHFFLSKPARPMELAKLLNELHVYLGREDGAASSDYVEAYRPEEHFVGILREAAAQRSVVWLKHSEYPIILVDGANKMVYTKTSQKIEMTTEWFLRLEAIDSHDVTIASVDQSKVEELIKANQLTAHSLEYMLWHVTTLSAKGALYHGVSAFQPVEITHWPNIEKIGREPYVTKLAAYMLCHKEDLVTVANKTQTPFTRVVDFYNACLILGYATHPAEHKEQSMQPLSRRIIPFLSRRRRADSHC